MCLHIKVVSGYSGRNNRWLVWKLNWNRGNDKRTKEEKKLNIGKKPSRGRTALDRTKRKIRVRRARVDDVTTTMVRVRISSARRPWAERKKNRATKQCINNANALCSRSDRQNEKKKRKEILTWRARTTTPLHRVHAYCRVHTHYALVRAHAQTRIPTPETMAISKPLRRRRRRAADTVPSSDVAASSAVDETPRLRSARTVFGLLSSVFFSRFNGTCLSRPFTETRLRLVESKQ